MRARGFGVLLGVLLGAGCTEINNYYDCQAVDDGGCSMRPTADRWGDDMLEDDAGPHRGTSSVFTEDATLHDSVLCTQGAPAQMLVNARTRDDVPRILSINLAVPVGQSMLDPDPGMVPMPVDAEPVAILDVGIGGTAYVAEIDYGMGLQFSLVASRVRISAEYRQFRGTVVPFPPNSIQLGASIGQGTVTLAFAPTRTVVRQYLLPGLLPAGADLFAIPMFARTLVLHTDMNPTGAAPVVQVRFYREGLGSDALINVITTPSGEIPLPPDARYVRLTNNSAVNVLGWRAVFALAL